MGLSVGKCRLLGKKGVLVLVSSHFRWSLRCEYMGLVSYIGEIEIITTATTSVNVY